MILQITDLGDRKLEEFYAGDAGSYGTLSQSDYDFGVLFYFWREGPKDEDYWIRYNLGGNRRPAGDHEPNPSSEMTSPQVRASIKRLQHKGYLEYAGSSIEETPTFGEPANGGLDDLERHYDDTPVHRGEWREVGHDKRRKYEARRIRQGFGPTGRPNDAPEGPYSWNV